MKMQTLAIGGLVAGSCFMTGAILGAMGMGYALIKVMTYEMSKEQPSAWDEECTGCEKPSSFDD